METLWERFKNGLFEGAVTVAERAEQLSYIGRIRLDIANDKRRMHASFAELGRRVHTLLTGSDQAEIAGDGEVLGLIRRIRDQEEVLREREAALASLTRAGKSASAGSDPDE